MTSWSSTGIFPYTYNAAGQLAEKVQGTELTRYSYGVLGELQRVELPDGRAITYQYDALKRRIGRLVDGGSTHRFLWGGGPGPVAELDANGNSLTTFVYGTGISSPDYMVRGAETFALIRDHLGSVRFVLNTADNAIAQELGYDPFGKVILDTNPGFQPFGYAGGLYDPDTELTRFGARDYNAHTGRWTARDPIAFAGGQTNLYVYVGNDPINFVDPNGTVALPAAVLAALGAIWAGIEFSLTVVDIIDTATTLMDSCSSDIDKAISVSGLIGGAIGPGGGYGVGGKELVRKTSGPDFLVGSNGVTAATSQSRMRKGFDDAGFDSQEVISRTSGRIVGQSHTLPGGNIVRTMDADGRNPRRASFTNANGGAIDPFTGKPPQPPSGLSRAERKQFVREWSHLVQGP